MALRRPRVLVLALVLAAGACGWDDAIDSRSATAGLPSTRQDIEAREWVLDRDDSSLTVDDDNPVTLSVRGDQVSGTAPCNVYRGSFDLEDDDSVQIGDIALTRRMCEESTMRAEEEFITALGAVDHVSVNDDGDRLTLSGDDDEVRLAFRAYDADELLVGTWQITGVATGTSIESVLSGTEPTVTFHDDGDVTLETGCNTAAGSWELDGHELTIGTMRITLRECSEPAGVMDQETALVAALEAADRVEIVPGELMVLDDEGRITLVAVQP